MTLARTRLTVPNYLLADTPGGRREEVELAGLPLGVLAVAQGSSSTVG